MFEFRRLRLIAISVIAGIVVFRCGPVPDFRTLVDADIHPPQFIRISATSVRGVMLQFDEGVKPVGGSVTVTPDNTVSHVAAAGSELVITLARNEIIGKQYAIEAAVTDNAGNSTTVLTQFYGFNPQVPRAVINEFTTKGSSDHPDKVELYVESAGNLAGMCLYAGTPGSWDSRIVFPSVPVDDGDYVIVHFKPTGSSDEIDETTDKTASAGIDASPTAFDEWVPGGTGLTGNNGVISLYATPDGKPVDAVLYSDRTATSDTDYGGFGSSSAYERATELAESGGWKFAGEQIAPEDAVNPDDSTATRSIDRLSDSTDTDRAADWHIVPTSEYSFGSRNSDAEYVPDSS